MNRDINCLQYLRGIAAILVVFSHAQLMLPNAHRIVPYFFGNAGVFIFFSISGFLMVYVTDRRKYSAADFSISRLFRVVPMYWICTTGAALMLLAAPSLGRGTDVSWSHYILSILFIPHWSNGTTLPFLRVGWTLVYEMLFYGLFAVAIAISERRRVSITVAALLALVASKIALNLTEDTQTVLAFYGNPLVFQFAFGMGLAVLHRRSGPMSATMIFMCLVTSIAWMVLFDSIGDRSNQVARVISYGLPSALIVWVAVMSDRLFERRSTALHLLGDASYSIYLTHMLTLAIARFIWVQFVNVEPTTFLTLGFVLGTTLTATCTGILIYWFIERPILTLRTAQRFRPRSASSSPGLSGPS